MLVAAAGNEGIDLNHPTTDEISPDFPPGAAVTRPVNNSCVVLPTEIPGVVVVTATGAENLLSWYSTYGNITDVTAPGGSRFQTPTFDPNRGRVLATVLRDGGRPRPRGRPRAARPGRQRQLLRLAERDVDGRTARRRRRRAHPGRASRACHGVRSWRLLRSTATGQACPAALDPGVEFFGAPVQVCSGGSGNNNFYGKGLVNALAASH